MTQRQDFITEMLSSFPDSMKRDYLNINIENLDAQFNPTDEKKPIKSIRPDFIHAYLESGRVVED